MRANFVPGLDVLPPAQQEMWQALAPLKSMAFVLYPRSSDFVA
jgi:hypothetical protein